MPRLISMLLLSSLLTMAQAAPMTLTKTAKGTVLSGKVIGWNMGVRDLAIIDNNAKVLTKGSINVAGQFSILLPSPAQMKSSSVVARERYNVAGCNDQPSDYDNTGEGSAQLFFLSEITVLSAWKPKNGAKYWKDGYLRSRWTVKNAQGETWNKTLILMYSDKEFGASLAPMGCEGSTGSISYETKLSLMPGWNFVWDGLNGRIGEINAKPTDQARWIYSTSAF